MGVIWHGTEQESLALVNAVSRYCSCQMGLMGVRLSTCASHRMLMEDQRALDGLLFAHRIAGHLRAEEGVSTHAND